MTWTVNTIKVGQVDHVKVMQYKSPMDLGKMAVVNANTPALLRVVASSVAIARRSGTIIRGILKGGDLGIVDKVTTMLLATFQSRAT